MRGNHILIIEPDAFLAGIYASKFAQENMKSEVAETISDAKKKISKNTPKGIVIDVSMEKLGGFDFIHEIRKEPATYAIPIFVLTSLGEREHIAKAFAAGATDYLIKGHFVPIEAVRKVKKFVVQN